MEGAILVDVMQFDLGKSPVQTKQEKEEQEKLIAKKETQSRMSQFILVFAYSAALCLFFTIYIVLMNSFRFLNLGELWIYWLIPAISVNVFLGVLFAVSIKRVHQIVCIILYLLWYISCFVLGFHHVNVSEWIGNYIKVGSVAVSYIIAFVVLLFIAKHIKLEKFNLLKVIVLLALYFFVIINLFCYIFIQFEYLNYIISVNVFIFFVVENMNIFSKKNKPKKKNYIIKGVYLVSASFIYSVMGLMYFIVPVLFVSSVSFIRDSKFCK